MQHFAAFIFILLATVGTFFARKLSLMGALTGATIASACYTGGGWRILGCLAAFFVLSVLATRIQAKEKLRTGLAERDGGPRLASQVLANGAVAAICSLAAIVRPDHSVIFLLAAAAAFASATADTLSSEIGNAFGSRYWDLVTLRSGKKGNNGVVSLEGTAAGFAGSLVIALIACTGQLSAAGFFSIIFAGNAAGLFDSLLGGTLENRQLLTNDQVNFLNTAFGALTAAILYSYFG